MFDHTCIKRIDGAFLHRQIEGETFIAALDGGASFMLNPVGTLIWELADGQHALAEIASAVCDRCDVTPETALQDARELAEELLERGLVVEIASGKSQTRIYRLSPAVAIEDFGVRSLALHCTELRLVELNATVREMLRRLDGETDLAQLADSLACEYNQPLETIQADVQTIIDQMAGLGIVEQVLPTSQETNKCPETNPCSHLHL